jgi:hypothetical protein
MGIYMDSARVIQYLKDLKASGVPEEQAEAQLIALESMLQGLATKSDLKAEIKALRTELKSDIKEFKSELKYFMVYSILGFIYAPIIVGVILKYFGKF